MASPTSSVLLAESHHGLAEGIRSLLGTAFDAVVMVADESSMCETARRLCPQLAVVDLALAHGDICGLISRLRLCCAGVKVILLSAHAEPAIVQAALKAGVEGLVSKREIATELLLAVEDVLRGDRHFPK